jgi:hypothetical protein
MLKELIKEVADFEFYRKGELHYITDQTGFRFVVPIEDCGDGEFQHAIKGITMMRWIRKQLEANQVGREAQ